MSGERQPGLRGTDDAETIDLVHVPGGRASAPDDTAVAWRAVKVSGGDEESRIRLETSRQWESEKQGRGRSHECRVRGEDGLECRAASG
jgi:hypothetical protein